MAPGGGPHPHRAGGPLGPRRWTNIAAEIPGRTGKQARERWLNQLSPTLCKRPWTEEEGTIVREAHSRLGNRWSEIAKLLKSRTDNACKNYWNTTIRREMAEANARNVRDAASCRKRKFDDFTLESGGGAGAARLRGCKRLWPKHRAEIEEFANDEQCLPSGSRDDGQLPSKRQTKVSAK